MTWTHYLADLEDILNRKAEAAIECDKHTPRMIRSSIGYMITEGRYAGCVGWSVSDHESQNTAEGERYLVGKIKEYAAEHGLRLTKEEHTKFSNLNNKS